MLIEDIGIALRGLFIINPEGVLEQITINNLPVCQSARVVRTNQSTTTHIHPPYEPTNRWAAPSTRQFA